MIFNKTDNAAGEQHTDPAFIAYIKGEITDPAGDPDANCQQTAVIEKGESQHVKKTAHDIS